MHASLAGKHGIVTGARSGIGRAIAEALASEGVSLTIASRSADELESVAQTLQHAYDVDVDSVPTDVRDPSAVATLIDEAIEHHGDIDIVINNAGTGVHGGVEDVTTEGFQTVVETNINGTFYVAREALPALRVSGGTLVFIGSFAGQFPFPANPVYAGTKAWVRQFAHSIEASVGDDGVAVSVVNPGGVRTGFEVAEGVTQADRYDPGEAPEPEEVADCVLFACRRTDAATVHEINLYRRDQLAGFR